MTSKTVLSTTEFNPVGSVSKEFAMFFKWVKDKSKNLRMPYEKRFLVGMDQEGIHITNPKGKRTRVPFEQLEAIMIQTNDEGPFCIDLWWVFINRDGTLNYFPGGATGETQVVEQLTTWPDFDDLKLIEAMGSVHNATFLCWSAAHQKRTQAC